MHHPRIACHNDAAENAAFPSQRRNSQNGAVPFAPPRRAVLQPKDEKTPLATICRFLANPEYGDNTGRAVWRALGFDDRFVRSGPFGWYDGKGAAAE
jgi:hypothetical protein